MLQIKDIKFMRFVKQYIKMGSNVYKVMNRWDLGKFYYVVVLEVVLK